MWCMYIEHRGNVETLQKQPEPIFPHQLFIILEQMHSIVLWNSAYLKCLSLSLSVYFDIFVYFCLQQLHFLCLVDTDKTAGKHWNYNTAAVVGKRKQFFFFFSNDQCVITMPVTILHSPLEQSETTYCRLDNPSVI